MTDEKDFIGRIRVHAASLGMTPGELVRAAGVADSTWLRWRLGMHSPNMRTLEKILAYQYPADPEKPVRRGIA